jgi:3-phosphoshikimate 1-carboxyvinyltransferase
MSDLDPAPARRVVPLDGPLDAVVRVPGSKSITNRALVCAALATGTTTLDGVLFADDTEAMLESLGRLGVVIDVDRGAARLVVVGTGGELPPGPVELDARMSGTTARFLAALLASGPGPYVLDGAEPMRARPMADGLDALERLGASIAAHGQPGHLPVTIAAGEAPAGGEARLRADVSSQFVSGLLLSAPLRPNGLTVRLDGSIVSQPYLDLTVAVMADFGVVVARPDDRTFVVPAGGYRTPDRYHVEPDASAASYFFAAPTIVGGRVRVVGLGRNARQGDVRFVDVLEQMGAEVERADDHIEVRSVGPLRGTTADLTDFSDTAQTLATTAVFAEGPTSVTGIGFIRRKETDRVAAVVTELARCGIEATEDEDGFTIHPGTPVPAIVRTYDDHRMAMSFALLGLRADGIEIADPGCVAKTFPAFWDVLDSLASGGNAAGHTGPRTRGRLPNR